MTRSFWQSAGLHLLKRTGDGWLGVTPDFLRAYFTRPEVHPIETSCAAEVQLFEELMADPALPVGEDRLERLADPDARDNYRAVLAFRARLLEAGTVEGAYLALVRAPDPRVPPVFLDQLVHVILRNILDGCRDPMRLRAAELLFREQTVSTEGGRILLADEEILDLHARAGTETGLAQLLIESATPQRQVTLDVLGEDNKQLYWARSDRFDMVLDLRFGEPGADALARVIEAWIGHFMRQQVRVEPRPKLEDSDWRWHIGLDKEANRILNLMYDGKLPSPEDLARIIGLYRMRFADESALIERVRGHPIYLALAATADKRLRMKPQNLLLNLPLRSAM